jgi:hypothetical protein
LLDCDGTSVRWVYRGGRRRSPPAGLLNRNVEELHRCLYVDPIFEWNLQWEMIVDKLTEVVPVCVAVAEAGGHVGEKDMGIEDDQDRGVVRG